MKKLFVFRREIPILIFVLSPLIYVLYAWSILPERIPIHWNLENKIDGWGGKGALLLMPGFSLLFYFLMLFFPRLDPKRKNYERFGKAYYTIRLALHAFFAGATMMIVLAAQGVEVNAARVLMAGVALLFLVLGNVMGTVKPNYFVGFRTAWTLNDEEVWTKTHRFAARVWFIGSLVAGAMIFLPLLWAAVGFFTTILVMVIVPGVYSYRLYKNKRMQEPVK